LKPERNQVLSENKPTGALAGVKVVDLSRVLGGPYCTQMLADHGAEVIKVEPPQGDETRDWGPPFEDGLSAYFSGINRNKRSIAIDIATPAGRAVLLRLLNDADVLIDNFKAGTMEKWGIGYAELSAKFPRLIHCRITGFGSEGPLGGFPGYDAMVAAWAGLMSVNGSPESGPMRLGVPLVDIGTGLNAASGILMAMIERGRSGKGQFIETTLFDTALVFQHPHAPNVLMDPSFVPKPTGNRHPTVVPYQVVQAKGRAVLVGAGNDGQFRKFCAVLGRPELADDPRFRTNKDRQAHRDELAAIIEPIVAEQDGETLAMTLMNQGVPAGALFTVPDVLAHPHTKARQMIVEKDGYRGLGIPIKLGRTPASVRRTPPLFGQHTREVLLEAGYSAAEIDRLVADGTALTDRRK
jgi:formyl-CoA transferase